MNGKLLSALLLMAAFMASACSQVPEESDDIRDVQVAGRINGKNWHYRYALIYPAIRGDDESDAMFVFLPFKPKETCPSELQLARKSRQIRLIGAVEPGRVDIRDGSVYTLAFQSINRGGQVRAQVGGEGRLELSDVDEDRVVGKLFARSDDDNWVSGRFEADICNQEPHHAEGR